MSLEVLYLSSLLKPFLYSGCMPIFAPAIYHRFGDQKAGSLIGGLTVAFAPLPFLLMWYGAKIRGKSRMAGVIARQQEERMRLAMAAKKADA